MKRRELVTYIIQQGGVLLREGRRHSIYRKGRYRTQIPRHTEIVDELARKICKDLNIPFVKQRR
jgi:mRNA interferase HicA